MNHDEIIFDKGYWCGAEHCQEHFRYLIRSLKKEINHKQISKDCGGSVDCYEKKVLFLKGFNSALNKLTKKG